MADLNDELPPGQTVARTFPVVTFGGTPRIDLAMWELRVEGDVDNPLKLTWQEFQALPRVTQQAELHCVSGWSRLGDEWEGVLARTVIDMARPKEQAGYVLLTAHGGHTTSLDLDALLDAQTLLAFKFNGQDLEPEHGWPVRLLVPKKYGYKSLKWVRSIRVLEREELGYWEQRGWSNRADPWLEDK